MELDGGTYLRSEVLLLQPVRIRDIETVPDGNIYLLAVNVDHLGISVKR